MDVTGESFEAAAIAELNKLPRVSGSREAARFYISSDTDATFTAAQNQAQIILGTGVLPVGDRYAISGYPGMCSPG